MQLAGRLWPALADVPEPFVLYGGTVLALRLAHRASVDFDFFAAGALDAGRLLALPFVGNADVLQRQPDTLTLSVRSEPPVKVSFFGGIDVGRVGHPERTDDGVLQVAGSGESRRHRCISRRAARSVGVATLLVVPTTVPGAPRAGARGPAAPVLVDEDLGAPVRRP